MRTLRHETDRLGQKRTSNKGCGNGEAEINRCDQQQAARRWSALAHLARENGKTQSDPDQQGDAPSRPSGLALVKRIGRNRTPLPWKHCGEKKADRSEEDYFPDDNRQQMGNERRNQPSG